MEGKKGARGYVVWNDDMDEALLDTLVEHHGKGDRSQNGWKPHVHTAAVKNVNEKCGVKICKDNVNSRCKTFDKHYQVISKMLGTSGFGWDWNKNKVSVDNDSKNPEASKYRFKVVKFWDKISIVCCRDHATGDVARTGAESSKEMESEDFAKEPGSSSSGRTLKRQRSDDSFNSMMAEKIDKITEALKEDTPKQPASKDILHALDEIPDLDEDTKLDLFDILTADDHKFESLMALEFERRRRWLLKQLPKGRP